MIRKTLYFGNPAYLSLENNWLVVKIPAAEKSTTLAPMLKEESVRKRFLDEIGTIIIDNKQITITSSLMMALLKNNCAIIFCDEKGLPAGLQMHLGGNSKETERIQQQIVASEPLKKQLWKQIIEKKIWNQAMNLKNCTGIDHQYIINLCSFVKSGDDNNCEASAAKYYWQNLFGDIGFTRERFGQWPNNLLNYGYAILRSIVARELVATGLLPAVGIHHHNKYNSFCLADDIMEPYRPYVDALVYTIFKEEEPCENLSSEHKFKLMTIPTLKVRIKDGHSPLETAVSMTVSSLQKCYEGTAKKLILPEYDYY